MSAISPTNRAIRLGVSARHASSVAPPSGDRIQPARATASAASRPTRDSAGSEEKIDPAIDAREGESGSAVLQAARAAAAAAARTDALGCDTTKEKSEKFPSKSSATISSAAASAARAAESPAESPEDKVERGSSGRITLSLPPDPSPRVAPGARASDDPDMACVSSLSASSCARSGTHGVNFATRRKNSGRAPTKLRHDFGRAAAMSAHDDSAAPAASMAACGERSASRGPGRGSAAVSNPRAWVSSAAASLAA